MSDLFKSNLFDYDNDGETSMTEYIIGQEVIKNSNRDVYEDFEEEGFFTGDSFDQDLG